MSIPTYLRILEEKVFLGVEVEKSKVHMSFEDELKLIVECSDSGPHIVSLPDLPKKVDTAKCSFRIDENCIGEEFCINKYKFTFDDGSVFRFEFESDPDSYYQNEITFLVKGQKIYGWEYEYLNLY